MPAKGAPLEKIFPFLAWFKGYDLQNLRADLLAGITVALVLIPQSMAYAQLAGLPPYYGLFAAFLPPMMASLFGSSRQLATGPVAIVSLMTATALQPYATAGGAQFIAYALLLALLVGAFQVLLGVLRLGLVVNFLSHPVVNGFTNAAALIIASSQLSKFFGVHVDSAPHHYETVWRVLLAAKDHTHLPTLCISAAALAGLWGLKKLSPRMPSVLVVVAAATFISWRIGYEATRTVPLSALAAPGLEPSIEEFNQTLATRGTLSERRILYSRGEQPPADCTLCHERRAAIDTHSLLAKHHELNVLDFKLTESQELVRKLRKEIRSRSFEGTVDGGFPRFFPAGKVPADRKGDGLRWRLKVDNAPMDPDALFLNGGGDVVGRIPAGLPSPELPKLDYQMILKLLPMALIITLLGFMEAISIAKAIAAKTGSRLDPNQELIGQGLANMAGSVFQSYPVSGSFSRSAVNFQAGAATGLSNVFCSGLVVITLLFLTPLLYHLPQAVLAAIIMMAVIGLINFRGMLHAWQTQKHDGAVAIVTFAATLVFAPHLDRGIFIGVGLTLLLYLYRTMKPEIVLLSRYTDGSYRPSSRFNLAECPHIAVLRCSSSLFFANVNYLEDEILDRLASMPKLRHVHLVGNAINELDASGEEMLSVILERVHDAGCGFSVSGINFAVLDVMRRTGLYERIGEKNMFRSVASAIESLHASCHKDSEEAACPLLEATFRGMPVKGETEF